MFGTSSHQESTAPKTLKRSRECSPSAPELYGQQESTAPKTLKRSRECSPSAPELYGQQKHSHLDLKTLSTASQHPAVICAEKPLCQSRPFSSYEEYEVHYAKMHTNRCVECHKNFPSDRFLNLHIKERHDPLSQIRLERGEKIFDCFVDGCDRICRTPFKRKRHLIDKHGFPEDYNFFLPNDGIDHSISLLAGPRSRPNSYGQQRGAGRHHPNSSQSTPNLLGDKAMEQNLGLTIHPGNEEAIKEISGLLTAMRFVPSSVRFGRKGS